MLPTLLTLLGACADLPEGWQGASRIDDLDQAACDSGLADTDWDEDATATATAERVEIVYLPVIFRCAQDVEGFWREADGHVEVLVQPQVMHPRVVAGCDCRYRVRADVWAPGASRFSAWRRWDGLNDDNDPVLVGEGAL